MGRQPPWTRRLDRLMRIYERIAQPGGASRHEILTELGISRATFARDLELLRDYYGVEIVWNHHTRRYHCTQPWDGPVALSSEELQTLLVLLDVLDGIQSEALRDLLAPLKGRILQVLGELGGSPEELPRLVEARILGGRPVDPEVLQRILQTLLRRHTLDIYYRARYNEQATRRRVHPQRLIYHRDNWYLLAWCNDRQDLRIFSLDRIERCERVSQRARVVPEAELAARLRRGFGVYISPPEVPVRWARLRFAPESARWVRDERWHPEQRLVELDDGGIELSVPYQNPAELILEILRHGDGVEVLEPEELRAEVAARLERALARYRT